MRNELSRSAKANLSGRFWCVENFTLMDVLTEPERDKLQQYLQHRDYKAGEAIYFPGDPSDTVYAAHEKRSDRLRLQYVPPPARLRQPLSDNADARHEVIAPLGAFRPGTFGCASAGSTQITWASLFAFTRHG